MNGGRGGEDSSAATGRHRHPDSVDTESIETQTSAMIGDEVPRTDPERGSTGTGTGHRHRVFIAAGRSVVALAAVLLLTITGVEWFIKSRADAGIEGRSVSAVLTDDTHIAAPSTVTPTEGTATTPAASTLSLPALHPSPAENVLLLGSDSRAGANAQVGVDDTIDTSVSQSDTLMIVHISADRQHITVISIPRDLEVDAPTCHTWSNGVVSESVQPVAPGEQWKITNTYAVGGPACTVRAVQQLTGLRIDRVIGIDFVGFKAMVDALGGIQVTICQPIIDATLNTVISQAGPQIINGDTALDLVRARKVQGEDSGDIGRIHRQQVVLSSLLRQVISAGTLLNPGKLDAFLQAFVQNTYTDNVTIDDLVTLTASFGSLDPSEVTFFTLPVRDNQDGSDGLLPDTAAATMFTDLVNDQPLPGEPPGTPMTGTATAEPGDAESSTEPATTTASDPPSPPDLPTVNAGQPVCA